ncbi:unnamed protein product [Leuciscus chuanchicus]
MTLGIERPICEVLQLRPQPVYFASKATSPPWCSEPELYIPQCPASARSETTCAPRLDRPIEEKHQAITLKTLLNTLQDTKNIVRAKYLKKQTMVWDLPRQQEHNTGKPNIGELAAVIVLKTQCDARNMCFGAAGSIVPTAAGIANRTFRLPPVSSAWVVPTQMRVLGGLDCPHCGDMSLRTLRLRVAIVQSDELAPQTLPRSSSADSFEPRKVP